MSAGGSQPEERLLERRYSELFSRLDVNRDGRVDVSEIRAALQARGLQLEPEAQQVGSLETGPGSECGSQGCSWVRETGLPPVTGRGFP
eukprot:g20921.t1